MNSALPLRAVKDSYRRNVVEPSNDNKIELGCDFLKLNKKSHNLKIVTFEKNNPEQVVDTKQIISGYFDGQVIKDLPEQGVKILFADQNLRNQYYDLRHKIFTEVDEAYREKHPEDCYDWEDYDGSEIEDDRCGRILVAVDKEEKVVAGVRFLVSDWIKHTANEVPEADFTIEKFFKKIGLSPDTRYVEVEDTVVEKPYRNHVLMREIYSVALLESKKLGCDCIIGVGIKAAARNGKILFSSLGCKVDVVLDYPWIRQKNHGYETRYPVVAYFKE